VDFVDSLGRPTQHEDFNSSLGQWDISYKYWDVYYAA
jgi:hypothetical protein